MSGQSTAEYTVDDVAARLAIPPEQVRGLIAAGELETTGSGDALRVTPDSLLIYMTSRVSTDLRRSTGRPRALSIAIDILLPVLMTLWFMGVCGEVYALQQGKPVAPAPAVVAVLSAVLALAWWLARQASDFSSTQGAGTAFYGEKSAPDGRVGTQWLIFADVPLLPVRSYVILEAGEATSRWSGTIETKKHTVRPRDRIYWAQALPILAGVWGGIAGLVTIIVLTGQP